MQYNRELEIFNQTWNDLIQTDTRGMACATNVYVFVRSNKTLKNQQLNNVNFGEVICVIIVIRNAVGCFVGECRVLLL